MDVWQLMDYGVELGLYQEYNFPMASSDYDPCLQHTVKEGVQIARALGADIAKISMDLKRPDLWLPPNFIPSLWNNWRPW